MLFKVVSFGIVVRVKPVLLFNESIINGSLIIFIKLVSELLRVINLVTHLVDVVLKLVASINLFFDFFILISKLLTILNHSFDFLRGKTTFIVGNSDSLSLTNTLLVGANSEDRVLIHLEGDLDLGSTSWSRWDTSEIKLTKLVVILDKSTLTFVNGNGDSSLLVLVSSENLRFLGWDDGTSRDDLAHHTANSLNTKGKGGNINDKEILISRVISSKDTTLDGGTIGNGFIRVNTSVRFLAIKKVFN
mmetsp:Transcript_19838/g.14272  ORF Transcript_19838/g.14272 Transcript_19838/m.14272 type:complete len:247 (-) Transcript_19838:1248-1988(-)